MITASDRGQVYLQTYLSPLAKLLQRADVTDLYINVPGEVWIETQGGETEHHNVPALDTAVLTRLARQIAAHAIRASVATTRCYQRPSLAANACRS